MSAALKECRELPHGGQAALKLGAGRPGVGAQTNLEGGFDPAQPG
jgi:hypothetical protein